MTIFKYQALDPRGEKVSGQITAYDEFEAVDLIKKQNPVLLKIEAVTDNKKSGISLNDPLWISEKVLALTASQFSILLKAGLPLNRTVATIASQINDRLMKRVLTEVSEDVAAGYSLANSLELRGKKIPQAFIETVRAGEASGTLEQSFDKLAVYYEKSYKLRQKVRSAMSYPILLIVLAIVVIAIVVRVAVPAIGGVILENGGALPGPTQFLINVYNFFGKAWPYLLVLVLMLIVLYKLYQRTETGRLELARAALKLPVFGPINMMNAASQFAGTMVTLLSAGIPMIEAVQVTGSVMDNYASGKSVRDCAAGLSEGRSLADVLQGNEYLPGLMVEMAGVGEASGNMVETLETIGSYYDSEVEQSTSGALSKLEPIITLVMGVVIGFIVLALYLPMFTMYDVL